MRPRDPCAEFSRGPHDLVGGAVDRGARLHRACGGEISGRSRPAGRPWARAAREQGPAKRRARARAGASPSRCKSATPWPPGQAAGPTKRGSGLDRARVDAANLGDAAGEGRQLHRLAERDEPLAVELRRRQRLERRLDRHVSIQSDELFRDPDALDALGVGQRFATLRLLDLARPREQRLEVAIFGDELRCGLEPDAGRARDIVGRIAGKRLDVDHLVRADAEIFDHLGRAEAPLLARARDPGLAGSRVVHRDAGIDELHEILVGRDDEDVGAGLARLTRVSGDDVVGLVAALLDRDHAERRDGGAHQRELRHELVGRILPVRLVGRVEVAPERVLRLVEDHREMGRLVARRPVANELQHLGREQPHRAGREAIGPVVVLLVLADRLIIGAEDKRRAVDEKNMVAGADRTVGLGHGHHISDAGSERHPGEVRPALDGDRGQPSSGRERAASRAGVRAWRFLEFR